MNIVKIQPYAIDERQRILQESAERCARIDALGVDRRHVPSLKSLKPIPPEALTFEEWLVRWNQRHVGPRLVWRWIISGTNPPWRWSCPWNLFPDPWIDDLSADWVSGKTRT